MQTCCWRRNGTRFARIDGLVTRLIDLNPRIVSAAVNIGRNRRNAVFFEDLEEIASAASNANAFGENIGARRLHGVFEELLEDISYNAGGDDMPDVPINITAAYVREHVKAAQKTDLKKYIL